MATSTIMTQVQNIPWFTALWTLPLLYLVAKIVYNIYFHPLAKFPGPFFAKFTSIYPMMSMVKMNRIRWQHEMLEKYGSPVRVGTNELYFSDMKSWQDIYGQSSNPCPKEKVFYDMFTATGAVSILNERNKAAHARLRRLVSHAFSLKGLLQDEPMIHQKVKTLLDVVFAPAAAKKESVNIFHKLLDHYLDITTYLSFGQSFDCVSGKGTLNHDDLDAFMQTVPLQAFFPPLRRVPLKKIQDAYKALDRLIKFADKSVKDFFDKIEKDGDDYARGTFLRNLVDAVDPETGSKLTGPELTENTILFLVAGSDTTAVTTLYTIWEIGRRPDVRKKLLDEIRTKFPDPKHEPTYEETTELEYLNACIEETLRIWGPLSAGFPRVSPGKTIGDHFIPAGVQVATPAYVTCRDPKVFPNPTEYIPERWLNATSDMKNMSRPFSYGPRNCIGKHLADIGLHLTLTRLYQLYDIEIDPSMTDAMMVQKDRGVSAPWDEKLIVRPTFVHEGIGS
ncbi:hypothetical protein LTR10_016904 [Elasticomyces elasticus]|uniref:Uncharacterized protein n=1 Tax=Exophiala sideris TaxID=1016849 RepID=A0ABR0JJT5_9EURO|nr:hypothetical protein LTR10_016904 [Elasticomyces elasticus]KAK5035327.1 hypothetical protein LTS07_002763 [Exophiala sideris]KAK5039322.1 hypothetical protein LTR13_003579 [Exophiala sideris]KAK5066251.1 hypothetical protein LTR69_002769 [Exophiala sideris]KAK5186928.1 hypothetical protein LTR44_000934 [Eurotiomycetes sp. CCFEE 6388]